MQLSDRLHNMNEQRQCHQVPHLPLKSSLCLQVPHPPRQMTLDVTKCHACHTKTQCHKCHACYACHSYACHTNECQNRCRPGHQFSAWKGAMQITWIHSGIGRGDKQFFNFAASARDRQTRQTGRFHWLGLFPKLSSTPSLLWHIHPSTCWPSPA